MLAIAAGSHAWTWPPTDKTHPQLNWRQPVPVTPEQEGFVHPVLPPEPPADDPPIDCRVPTDRARDFKPNFLRALIQLFTGIVAWSVGTRQSMGGSSAGGSGGSTGCTKPSCSGVTGTGSRQLSCGCVLSVGGQVQAWEQATMASIARGAGAHQSQEQLRRQEVNKRR